MSVLKYFLLLLIPFSAFADESHLGQDFYWFKETLKASEMSLENVDKYLNPYRGRQSFRLGHKNAPWAGNYYPMMDGGIAQRWQQGNYTLDFLSQEKVLQMKSAELRKLSPVEKFDILMGDYEFTATRRELNARGPLRELPPQNWEGFCNGVRCAGILLDEPRHEVTRVNKDGVKISFLPADLKALAGASYFWVEKYGQIGAPSQKKMSERQPHPVIFDLALRLHLAENKKSFVIDSHLGSEIWNETVVGYEREIEERPLSPEDKARFPGVKKKIRVHLKLETLGEIDIKDSNKATKAKVANGQYLDAIHTSYDLLLDSKNKPLEGAWNYDRRQGQRGVDFAWFANGVGMDSKFASEGGNPHLNFKVIQELFRESSFPSCRRIFAR